MEAESKLQHWVDELRAVETEYNNLNTLANPIIVVEKLDDDDGDLNSSSTEARLEGLGDEQKQAALEPAVSEADDVSMDSAVDEEQKERSGGSSSWLPLPQLEEAVLVEVDVKAVQYAMTIAEEEAERLKSGAPLTAIQEYAEKNAMYEQRRVSLSKVTSLRDSVRRKLDRLRKARLDMFMAGFR